MPIRTVKPGPAGLLRDQAGHALSNVSLWAAAVEIPQAEAIAILRASYLRAKKAKARGDMIKM